MTDHAGGHTDIVSKEFREISGIFISVSGFTGLVKF
jgi:hypothetical protein